MIRRAIVASLVTLALAAPVSAADYYIVVNEPAVHVGQTVTFTAYVPQSAMRQKRNPQYPFNPQTQVFCNGWTDLAFAVTKDRVTDGYIVTTYPLAVPVGGDGSASIYYVTQDKSGATVFNHVASTSFTVTE